MLINSVEIDRRMCTCTAPVAIVYTTILEQSRYGLTRFIMDSLMYHDIYFEKQTGLRCGLHTINNILQGEFYTEGDLDEIARELDGREREMLTDNTESSNYSENHDVYGNYSIEVIAAALSRYQLELVPFNSTDPRAVAAQERTCDEKAFICHRRDHWFTVCKIGDLWYKLDSLCFCPILLDVNDNTHVSSFDNEKKLESFTAIFIVKGNIDEARNSSPPLRVHANLFRQFSHSSLRQRLPSSLMAIERPKKVYSSASSHSFTEKEKKDFDVPNWVSLVAFSFIAYL